MIFEKLKRWRKQYGIKNILLQGAYFLLPVIPVDSNRLLRIMNWQLRARKRLKKYLVIRQRDDSLEENNPFRKTVWCLWYQGIENAPAIVRHCVSRAERYAGEMGYQFVLLDRESMKKYVEIPQPIWDKWESGKITDANFSDVCRVALLAQYGGIWLDSTVLLTGKIDPEILDADVFFFQASFMDMTVTKISSWFICAKSAGNRFLFSLRDSLINYWEARDTVEDKFLCHMIVAALSETEELREEFEKIPFFSNTHPSLMGMCLNDPYDEKKIRHILKCSSVHKLTYKNLDESMENSVYKAILDGKVDASEGAGDSGCVGNIQ